MSALERVKRFIRPPIPAAGSIWVSRTPSFDGLEYEVVRANRSGIEFALRSTTHWRHPSHRAALRWFHLEFVEATEPHANFAQAAQLDRILWVLMCEPSTWRDLTMAQCGALYGAPQPYGRMFVTYGRLQSRGDRLNRWQIDAELRAQLQDSTGAIQVLDAVAEKGLLAGVRGLRRPLIEAIEKFVAGEAER